MNLSAPAIVDNLATLFNASLDEAAFPSDWKRADVYPVLKSGDSQLLTNYRPISVLPGIAKVFETIIHQQVFSYFLSNNLLTPGFRPGHSTQDLLLKVVEDWKSVGTVFIDLSKTFDSIDHCLLLAKLSGYGISLQ